MLRNLRLLGQGDCLVLFFFILEYRFYFLKEKGVYYTIKSVQKTIKMIDSNVYKFFQSVGRHIVCPR